MYDRELLKTQLRHYEDTVRHLDHETELLKRFADQEKSSHERASIGKSSMRDVAEAMNRESALVDAEAARHFAIYLDQAQTNGYGYQAHLVQAKVVPKAQAAVAEIEEELSDFERKVSEDVRSLFKPRWEWRSMSEKAGIQHEHDYIYSNASKLLHATPASITTDAKNLEPTEVRMFLRYILVKMLQIIDFAQSQPECSGRSVP